MINNPFVTKRRMIQFATLAVLLFFVKARVDAVSDRMLLGDLIWLGCECKPQVYMRSRILFHDDQLDKIEELDASGFYHRMRSIDRLARLKNLRRLSLRGTMVTDISVLRSLPYLEDLDLARCVLLTNADPLLECRALVNVKLGMTSVRDERVLRRFRDTR